MLDYYVMLTQTPPLHHILTELSIGFQCIELGRNMFGDLEQHGWIPLLHSMYHHQERKGVSYSISVTDSFREPLDRQIMETVQIPSFKGPDLMN